MSLMVEDLGDPASAIHAPALATADHLGARYARLIVNPGTWGTSFNWDAKVTPFVQDSVQHQMKPYLTLGNGSSPPSASVYGSWCGEAASRYDGQGSHPLVLDYSAWNEPNFNGISGATYRDLYRACRSAIKAVLPSAKVYFGEIEAGGTGGCTFLNNALPGSPSSSDPAIVTDGLSIHPYQYKTDPRTAMPGSCQGIGNLPAWKSALASAVNGGRIGAPGGGTPPLLVSEFGYCTERTPAPLDNPYTSSSAVAACPQNLGGADDKLDDATRASYTSLAYQWAQSQGVAIFDYHGVSKRAAGDFLGNTGYLWESGLIENPSGAFTPSVSALRTAAGTQSPGAATAAASGVGPQSATLNGTVNPNGFDTTYRFEYGPTTAYGSSAPVPDAGAGAGTASVSESQSVTGLLPTTTYHYRLVAQSRTGTTYGADQTFTTPNVANVAFADAANGSSVTNWSFDSVLGWQQTFLLGHPVAAGSSPSAVVLNGTRHIFFVDAANGNTITDWTWNATSGWQQTLLFGHPAAPGTSPAAIVVNGTIHVFFVDATDNNTITDWTWTASGWQQVFLFGHPVAAGSSPSALVFNGAPQVFFADATNNGSMTAWVWSDVVGWQQTFMFGHPLAAGTSPSAVVDNGTPHVFYVDATDGNTMTDWTWNATSGWQQTFMFGHQVASGSSPSAVPNPSMGIPDVFFADAANNNSMTAWTWVPGVGWRQAFLFGHPVAAGSSPSAATLNGGRHVFFVDATDNDTLTDWTWNATTGWQQTFMFGHRVATGSSPAGW